MRLSYLAKFEMTYSLIAAVLISFGCERTVVSPPPRSTSVPEEASWAGGLDGGDWLLCNRINGTATRYACKIYSDRTGNLIAEGEFEYRRTERSHGRPDFLPTTHPPSVLQYAGYDGDWISLEPSGVLVPDGTMHFPLNPTTAKKQEYKLGDRVGEEVQYSIPAA